MILKGFILGVECWPSLQIKSTVAFRTTELHMVFVVICIHVQMMFREVPFSLVVII
jgi:hypothetical protein